MKIAPEMLERLDKFFPKLTEPEIAQHLVHLCEAGADPQAIRALSNYITRLQIELQVAKAPLAEVA